jgi:hypothetical protein
MRTLAEGVRDDARVEMLRAAEDYENAKRAEARLKGIPQVD